MEKLDDFNSISTTESERVGSPRDPKSKKRTRARALLNRQRLQSAATLMRVARRATALRMIKCKACGHRLSRDAQFCPACGADASAPTPVKTQTLGNVKKPSLFRRVLAQFIDRFLALPFLVMFYPKWMWAVLAFHLLCDAFTGRSPGKMICRIRVINATSLSKCTGLRVMLRRLGTAFSQGAYCRWETAPFALVYDLISFLFIWRDPGGQRLEDKLLGTRVLGEGVFRNLKRECSACGAMVLARERFCPKCGHKPR